MRISKEIRIGLLVAISFIVFFAGFYFLKGANVFSGENEFYGYYDHVQGLQPSSPVQIKGVTVGRVSEIDLNGGGKVKVTLAIKKKFALPKGTVAKLVSTDLLGTKAVRLDLSSPGNGYIEDGSLMRTSIEGGVIDNISTELTPLIEDVRHVVARLDTALGSVNDILNPQTRQRLDNSIASLETTMNNFNQLSSKLNAESGQIAGVIRNANSITTNLANNNNAIQAILKNAEATTAQLSQAPIAQTFTDLQSTMNQLQGVIDKINNNQGSLGMMVNDKQLYENLNKTLETMNALMADLNTNPSRYINVTIFGRKKQQ